MTAMTAMTIALATGAARAQGVPTFDAAAVAQAVANLDQMRRDYANQIEQLTNLKDQLESMTGDKAISGILNAAPDIAARQSADSLSSIMAGGMTGAPIPGNSATLTARINDLKSTFDLPDIDTFLTSTLPQDRALATQAGAGLAAIATAEDSYGRANASMGRVNRLIGDIDANADLKASVDYNTRMLGEVVVMLNEMVRVQAAAANTVGTEALQDARDRAAARTFMQRGDD
jgi:hypothetical protein